MRRWSTTPEEQRLRVSGEIAAGVPRFLAERRSKLRRWLFSLFWVGYLGEAGAPPVLWLPFWRRGLSGWWWTGGRWLHRPWWKVAINTVLRAFQPWPRKLVIYTKCERGPEDPDRPPRVLGYGFGLVLHRRAE